MGKRENVRGVESGKGTVEGGGHGALPPGAAVVDVNEHLSRDLARVRARFAMDPPLGSPPGEAYLKRAWMSEVALEEYEAEFVDTVADCLGAGLSLEDALTCWDSGGLAADDADVAGLDDEPPVVVLAVTPRRPTGGHRLLVR